MNRHVTTQQIHGTQALNGTKESSSSMVLLQLSMLLTRDHTASPEILAVPSTAVLSDFTIRYRSCYKFYETNNASL